MNQFKLPEGMALTGITKLPRYDPGKVWWQVSLIMTEFFEPVPIRECAAEALEALGMVVASATSTLTASGAVEGPGWVFHATVEVPVRDKDLF